MNKGLPFLEESQTRREIILKSEVTAVRVVEREWRTRLFQKG